MKKSLQKHFLIPTLLFTLFPSFVRSADITAPTVNVTSEIPDPTHTNPIPIKIEFSEEVTGFDISDIIVSNGTASNLQTSDNITWTADVTPIHTAAFSVNIHAGAASDLAGNPSEAAPYFQRTYDPNRPTVTLSSSSTDPTLDNPIVVKITLNESSWDELELSDIIVTNGTATNLQYIETGYHENWTVDIHPSSDGLVTVEIPAGSVHDYADNFNLASSPFSITCDIAPVIVSVNALESDGIYKTGNALGIIAIFNEPVSVTGTPKLSLNSGGEATFYSAESPDTVVFIYIVADGDTSADLDYLTENSLTLDGGSILDLTGNTAILTLPEPGSSNAIGGQKNIIIGKESVITTQPVSAILTTSATGHGTLTEPGFPKPSSYGICWNTSGTPSVSDHKSDKGSATTPGAFTASLSGLPSGTTIYVRAYAINDVATVYGSEESFTTNGIITYELSGGINDASNHNFYVFGNPLTLNDPTRNGYNFSGWFDNEDFTGSALTAISDTTKGDITLYAKWDPVVGIDNYDHNDVYIFPNPAVDFVYIRNASGSAGIYDMNGQLVLTRQIKAGCSIDISSLSKGVYLIRLDNRNYKMIKK